MPQRARLNYKRQHPPTTSLRCLRLAALRPADLALFVCNLKAISFSPGAGVLEAGAAMDHIYFPRAGTVSILTPMTNGELTALVASPSRCCARRRGAWMSSG